MAAYKVIEYATGEIRAAKDIIEACDISGKLDEQDKRNDIMKTWWAEDGIEVTGIMDSIQVLEEYNEEMKKRNNAQ